MHKLYKEKWTNQAEFFKRTYLIVEDSLFYRFTFFVYYNMVQMQRGVSDIFVEFELSM